MQVDAPTLNNLGVLLLVMDQIFKILKLLLIHLTRSWLICSILLLFTHHLCVLLLGHGSMLLLLLFSLFLFLDLLELLLVAV